MAWALRFGIVLLASALGAAWGWWGRDGAAGSTVVGAKRAGSDWLLPAAQADDVAAVQGILAKARIWGLEPNGQPIAAASAAVAGAAPSQWVEWHLLASVVRGGERYILIRSKDGEPTVVRQGERLPDGSLLAKVDASAVTVKPLRGANRVYHVQSR
jgi:hypothetical protein